MNMSDTTTAQAVRGIRTPEQHAQANKTKPVTLLALGTGPHGKTALLEFPEGWQRTIDLTTEFDGWHPLFDDLPEDDRRRMTRAGHVRAPFVIHEDGTQRRPAPLSFTRDVRTACGRYLESNYFDVPEQGFDDGAITGYHCVAELLEALALDHGPFIPLPYVLREVSEAANRRSYGTGRRAAAESFMEVVGDSLKFFAKHSNRRVFIARKIASAEHYKEASAEVRANDRVAFVIRMKAAKEAKRNARETAAGGMAA